MQVRLRLPIVLIVAALVVGQWDLIRNYWGRLTRVIHSESIARPGCLERHRVFLSDGPGRHLGLAEQVRRLQHGAGAPQARRSAVAAGRGGGADAALAEPNSTGRHPDGAGVVPRAREGI